MNVVSRWGYFLASLGGAKVETRGRYVVKQRFLLIVDSRYIIMN